jgi:hypothetical protein
MEQCGPGDGLRPRFNVFHRQPYVDRHRALAVSSMIFIVMVVIVALRREACRLVEEHSAAVESNKSNRRVAGRSVAVQCCGARVAVQRL